jgi:hypothetical protein
VILQPFRTIDHEQHERFEATVEDLSEKSVIFKLKITYSFVDTWLKIFPKKKEKFPHAL